MFCLKSKTILTILNVNRFIKKQKIQNISSRTSKYVQIFDSSEEVIKDIPGDASLMIGGFGLVGVPESKTQLNLIRQKNKSIAYS